MGSERRQLFGIFRDAILNVISWNSREKYENESNNLAAEICTLCAIILHRDGLLFFFFYDAYSASIERVRLMLFSCIILQEMGFRHLTPLTAIAATPRKEKEVSNFKFNTNSGMVRPY